MCKFRFWRMEEPSAPTWDHNPARAFDPPVDAPFPDHLRITPATRSVFNWMTGHADCATKHDPKADALSRLSTDTLIQRLTWYSEEWSVELDAQFRRSTGPTNPHVTPETGQPAVLASLTAGYERWRHHHAGSRTWSMGCIQRQLWPCIGCPDSGGAGCHPPAMYRDSQGQPLRADTPRAPRCS
jgi:hypothetical protein